RRRGRLLPFGLRAEEEVRVDDVADELRETADRRCRLEREVLRWHHVGGVGEVAANRRMHCLRGRHERRRQQLVKSSVARLSTGGGGERDETDEQNERSIHAGNLPHFLNVDR